MNSFTNSHLHPNDSADFARAALSGMPGAHATVVNRTHRVIRERARVLQEKRRRDRSLMIPLLICSSLLILSALALWTGLYQYQAAETVEAVQSDPTPRGWSLECAGSGGKNGKSATIRADRTGSDRGAAGRGEWEGGRR